MRTPLSIVLLFAIACLLGLATNALREEPLPIFRPLPDLRQNEISLEDGFALFAQKKAVFLDARAASAYHSGKIIGSLNLPPNEFEARLPEFIGRLQDQGHGGGEPPTLITYCDGPRCPKAHALAALLAQEGHPKIFVLKDGFAAWKKGGYPTN